MEPTELITAARDASERALAPYSEYQVGAAVAAEETVYAGFNIEVANYSNSLHAEEVAVARALYAGETELTELAVATPKRDGVTPCGSCRQTLREFCPLEMPIYIDHGADYETYTLEELLPASFGGEFI